MTPEQWIGQIVRSPVYPDKKGRVVQTETLQLDEGPVVIATVMSEHHGPINVPVDELELLDALDAIGKLSSSR